MKQWYYKVGTIQTGPVYWEEIVTLVNKGTLSSDTLVWQHQLPKWTPYADVADQGPEIEDMYRVIHHGGQGIKTTTQSQGLPTRKVAVEETRIPFGFTGKGSEYFRIWVVNTTLIILTLGVYAAWAKIRRLRYFHGHTHLDGHNFDFTGKPIPILKGNLLFGSAAVIFMILQNYAPIMAFVVGVGLYWVAPLLIVKSLRFRARNTVYRNVRFAFWGLSSDAYSAYIWVPMLVPLTGGILKAYADYRKKLFTLGNFAWGDKDADMNGDSSYYYMTMFKAFGLMALASMGLSAALGLSGGFSPANLMSPLHLPAEYELVPSYNRHKDTSAESSDQHKEPRNTDTGQSKVIKVNEGFTIYRSGADIPQKDGAADNNVSTTAPENGKSRVLIMRSEPRENEHDDYLDESGNEYYDEEYGDAYDAAGNEDSENPEFDAMMEGVFAKMGMMIGAYIVLFVLARYYYQIRILNYSINNLVWKSIGRMESNMRFRDLLWIHISNAFLTTITLGIFFPWARIRLARYRADHTFLLATGGLDQALDTISPEASAIGDAGAEVFDFDIAF